MPELLFEIGTEEIPAGYIEPALEQLSNGLLHSLQELRLEADNIVALGSPRRLSIWADGIPERQKAVTEEILGPPAHVAYDGEKKPTGAAIGFARSQGLQPEQLKIKDTGKGPYVAAYIEHGGKNTLDILGELLPGLVTELSFPKSMRWPQPQKTEAQNMRFARPVRWLVAVFDSKTVPVSTGGIKAGNNTRGHPFLKPGKITLENASLRNYREKLKEAFVIVDHRERREIIKEQNRRLESEHVKVDLDEELLCEVSGLVEFPHALSGRFDEEFLCVPDCVLVAAMKKHQRYFPMRDEKGKLLNKFVIVSNRTKQQEDTVREGNQRVLAARLADARFFWEEDRKITLEKRVEMLEDVVYLGRLGNNRQRTERIRQLSETVAACIGLRPDRIAYVTEAASLCKADLVTGLVNEFPSLQGQVGRELARHEGKAEPVAQAIGEHYLPASSNGPVPASVEGAVLSLADKSDVIVCCYAMGFTADGSQDPFALRRNAIGILKILENKELDVGLDTLLEAAKCILQQQAGELAPKELNVDIGAALQFFRDRLYHEAAERDYRHDMTKAVLNAGFDRKVCCVELNYNVHRFWKRLAALKECSREKWWPELVEVVDRTYRIQKDLKTQTDINRKLLREEAEKILARLLEEKEEKISGLFSKQLYEDAARLYCETFSKPVHDFFDKVFVNVEDAELRLARKALCGRIYRLFAEHMADLYLIEL